MEKELAGMEDDGEGERKRGGKRKGGERERGQATVRKREEGNKEF